MGNVKTRERSAKIPAPRALEFPKAKQSNSRYSRPPLARMLQLHKKLLAGKFPNCRKLAGELEVSGKTIQRDIEFMRSQMGLPIEYNAEKTGFYYSEPVTSFPSMEVSEGEVVALLVAQKALAQYQGTSFEKPLKAAFEKITSALQDKVLFQWEEMEASISFRGLGSTVSDLKAFESVSKAVLKCHELAFEYRKLGSKSYETRRVQPYHLACVDQQWYLFAFDLSRQKIRTFVLARMRAVRSCEMVFVRPADFSIHQHLGNSLGVFTQKGGRHKVRIRFDAFAAQLVAERQWHQSQKIRPLPDGGIELQLELTSLQEIQRWVLSWGERARVLAPASLRLSVRASAQAILKQPE
jgi:predicted DNA-binding transcriptional regulator YafY